MAIIKNTNSDYVIQANESGANITLRSETVYISGNLTVTGTQTSINTGTIDLADNKIVLNSDWPIASPPTEDAGIIVNRGTEANVEIMYNEALNVWQLTNDGSLYANISSTTGVGFITAVLDDATPELGGNLDLLTNEIFSSLDHVKIDGNVQINYTDVQPTANVANATIFYTAAPAGGTTGLYVVNSEVAQEELITKTRAFGFSLIL